MLNCGDDDLMDFIDPQRLGGIHRVEQIIGHRLLGEKRKRQRDRMNNSLLSDPHRYEARINRRRDSRSDSTRRSEIRRDNRIDDHRLIHREKRDDLRFDHRERRDDLRFDHRERRDEQRLVSIHRQPWREGRTVRYEQDNSRRITLASATTDDLRAAVKEVRFRQYADQYDSQHE